MLAPQHPPGQVRPVWHSHTPDALQVEAAAPQLTHAAPPIPQVVTERELHALPAQHPVGQLVASQMQLPPEQRWPAAHCALLPQPHAPFVQRSARTGSQLTHAAPPVPQAATSGGATHVSPLQQPLGQLVALQRHTPLTHC